MPEFEWQILQRGPLSVREEEDDEWFESESRSESQND